MRNDSDGGNGDGARRDRDKGKGKAREGAELAPGHPRLEQWFAPGKSKGTGLRLSYIGPGHPLTILVCVFFFVFCISLVLSVPPHV